MRIGEGNLTDRIEVKTGDELEVLADQFNRMAVQLQESYAGLERKVEARTARAAGGARAADRDRGDPGGHQRARRPTCSRCSTRSSQSARAAVRGADAACSIRVDGDGLRSVATYHGAIPSRGLPRWPPFTRGPRTRASAGRSSARAVHVDDLVDDPTDVERTRTRASRPRSCSGARTLLAVPMLREGAPIGVIGDPPAGGPAVHRQADRAAGDVRGPGGDRDRERAPVPGAAGAHPATSPQSLEETGALSEVIRAVSSSLDLREVLDTVARRAIAALRRGRLRDLRAPPRAAGLRRARREPRGSPPSSSTRSSPCRSGSTTARSAGPPRPESRCRSRTWRRPTS